MRGDELLSFMVHSKVIRLCWVSQSIKTERGIKIEPERDIKSIDNTDNMRWGQKIIQSEKVGKGATFFSKCTI